MSAPQGHVIVREELLYTDNSWIHVVGGAGYELTADDAFDRYEALRRIRKFPFPDSLEPGVAAVVLCDGGHVDREHDPGLRTVETAGDGAGVWQENGILRVRFHLLVGDETASS